MNEKEFNKLRDILIKALKHAQIKIHPSIYHLPPVSETMRKFDITPDIINTIQFENTKESYDEILSDLIKILKYTLEDRSFFFTVRYILDNIEPKWGKRKEAIEQVDEFIKELNNSDLSIKERVMVILAKIADKKTIEPLVKIVLNTQNELEKAYALSALSKIGEVDEEVRKFLTDVLFKILLNDQDRYMRVYAIDGLSKIASNELIEPLLINILLNHKEDRMVRARALETLVEIANERAVEPLVKILLNDKSSSLRQEAISGLSKIANEKAIDAIIYVLNFDEDVGVRLYAVEKLGKIKNEKAVKVLIDKLNDPNETFYIRIEAAKVLSNVLGASAIPYLKLFLKDKHKNMQKEIRRIIKDLKKKVQNREITINVEPHL